MEHRVKLEIKIQKSEVKTQENRKALLKSDKEIMDLRIKLSTERQKLQANTHELQLIREKQQEMDL